MQSGQINASQLLGAFLGSVKARLGQAITKNDFSGELKKHLSSQLNAEGTPELEVAGAANTEASAAETKASATVAAVSSEAKTGASLIVQDKGLTDSSAKIKEIKSKAKTEKSLFLSNPAIVETILAKLHYPANVRDQCAELLNKQGRISIQNLRAILGIRPDSVSGTATGVPAAAVSTLLGSIVKVSLNPEGKSAAVEKSFKSSVAINPDGSYTRDELRGLLEKVIEESQKSSSSKQSGTLSSSSSSPSTVNTKKGETLKTEQAAELVSTVLPSFISPSRKVGAGKDLAEAAAGKVRGWVNADEKRADLRENLLKAGASANESSSQGSVGHEKHGSSTEDSEKIAPRTEAIAHGNENGASKDSAGGVAHGQVVQPDTGAGALGVAAELADWIKAAGSSMQSAPGASSATTGPDSLTDVESRAELGGQDTPVLGKDIEKLTGGKDQPSENAALQTAGGKLEDNLITLPQMNNSGGDGFVFYDRNGMAELAHDAHGAKTNGASETSLSDKGIGTILASYISAADENGSKASILTGNHDNQKSDAQGAKKTDFDGNTVKNVSKDANSVGQSGSDKAEPVGGGGGTAKSVGGGINGAGNGAATTTVQVSVEDALKSAKTDGRAGSNKAEPVGGSGGTAKSVGGGINGAGNGSSNASALSWSFSQQEAVGMPVGVMDHGAQSGDGQSSASSSEKNATLSVTATTGAERLTAAEQAVVAKQAVAVAAKRGEEPIAGKDSSHAAAAFQTSPANLQTINMHPANNSAQNGSSMYDPYRAVELANSMSEQAGIGAGRLLVLEMDSDGLGKINLKVASKKDQISVEAMTQNEPARQALMSHTVELRQDLNKQGLVLGKFMVDVNGGKPGRENGSGAHQSGGKGGKAFKATTTTAAPVNKSAAPVRAAAGRKMSQISIFA